jgi:Fur family transcriptional regulator, peroxide stress response regulator
MKQTQKKTEGPRFKRTPQRLAILEYLEGNTAHPSAEDIFRAVSKRYESMSFATVYNTLNTLTKSGELRELMIDPERKRYDPDTSRHHHLLCVLCSKVVDIPETIKVELPNDLTEQFTLLGTHVQFYGHCAPCKKKRKAS